MNFPDFLLPIELMWAANGLAAYVIVYCLKSAPWQNLGKPGLLDVFFGFVVLLMLLWSVKAGIKPGLNFHLLGVTLMSLMFGLPLALIACSLVLLGVTGFGMAGWQALGLNFLLMAFIPALFSAKLFKWVDARLPNHFFVYVYVSGFLCAGLAMGLYGLVSTFVLSQSGAYSGSYLNQNYLPYYIFMAWAEALLTGMLVTLMAAFRPDWLATFNDGRYLGNR